MNELVMRLCTLLTVVFAVSTTLWLAGMVQAQQSLGVAEVEAAPAQVRLASARTASSRHATEAAARPAEQAAPAALSRR